MIYIDPPYGIKYGSNFQPFVNKRDVKDRADEDLTQEPEMIKAFRDTWELGIHSYLTYLRDRLLLAKELLHETGSVFVQISDENLHHVREFLTRSSAQQISSAFHFVRKTSRLAARSLSGERHDYLIWYAERHRPSTKVSNKIYTEKKVPSLHGSDGQIRTELPNIDDFGNADATEDTRSHIPLDNATRSGVSDGLALDCTS